MLILLFFVDCFGVDPEKLSELFTTKSKAIHLTSDGRTRVLRTFENGRLKELAFESQYLKGKIVQKFEYFPNKTVEKVYVGGKLKTKTVFSGRRQIHLSEISDDKFFKKVLVEFIDKYQLITEFKMDRTGRWRKQKTSQTDLTKVFGSSQINFVVADIGTGLSGQLDYVREGGPQEFSNGYSLAKDADQSQICNKGTCRPLFKIQNCSAEYSKILDGASQILMTQLLPCLAKRTIEARKNFSGQNSNLAFSAMEFLYRKGSTGGLPISCSNATSVAYWGGSKIVMGNKYLCKVAKSSGISSPSENSCSINRDEAMSPEKGQTRVAGVLLHEILHALLPNFPHNHSRPVFSNDVFYGCQYLSQTCGFVEHNSPIYSNPKGCLQCVYNAVNPPSVATNNPVCNQSRLLSLTALEKSEFRRRKLELGGRTVAERERSSEPAPKSNVRDQPEQKRPNALFRLLRGIGDFVMDLF